VIKCIFAIFLIFFQKLISDDLTRTATDKKCTNKNTHQTHTITRRLSHFRKNARKKTDLLYYAQFLVTRKNVEHYLTHYIYRHIVQWLTEKCEHKQVSAKTLCAVVYADGLSVNKLVRWNQRQTLIKLRPFFPHHLMFC